MKSLHDYIAEVTAQSKEAPAKVSPKPKKKSDPYREINHEIGDDDEANDGKGNAN
jgi:hypothetical protein